MSGEKLPEFLRAIDPEGIARIRREHFLSYSVWGTQGKEAGEIDQDIDPMSHDPKRGVQYRLWLLYGVNVNERSFNGKSLCHCLAVLRRLVVMEDKRRTTFVLQVSLSSVEQ